MARQLNLETRLKKLRNEGMQGQCSFAKRLPILVSGRDEEFRVALLRLISPPEFQATRVENLHSSMSRVETLEDCRNAALANFATKTDQCAGTTKHSLQCPQRLIGHRTHGRQKCMRVSRSQELQGAAKEDAAPTSCTTTHVAVCILQHPLRC